MVFIIIIIIIIIIIYVSIVTYEVMKLKVESHSMVWHSIMRDACSFVNLQRSPDKLKKQNISESLFIECKLLDNYRISYFCDHLS